MVELLKKNVAEIVCLVIAVSMAYYIETKISDPFDTRHFAEMSFKYAIVAIISLKIRKKFFPVKRRS